LQLPSNLIGSTGIEVVKPYAPETGDKFSG
jgi:hypothetical protein